MGSRKVADRAEPFVPRIRTALAGRTAELEDLAVEMYARGLSTRDIEAAFRDASDGSLLSRTAARQVTERLWQEYETFASASRGPDATWPEFTVRARAAYEAASPALVTLLRDDVVKEYERELSSTFPTRLSSNTRT